MGPAAVCFGAAVAATLTAAGVDVVLCGRDGTALAAAIAEHRETGYQGRMAVFVGEPVEAEEEVLVMAREMFGGEAVVVRSLAEAIALNDR